MKYIRKKLRKGIFITDLETYSRLKEYCSNNGLQIGVIVAQAISEFLNRQELAIA